VDQKMNRFNATNLCWIELHAQLRSISLSAIDLLLSRVNTGAFDPCLGRSSAGALDRKSPAFDRSLRTLAPS
jgi:hypothetical protein